MRVPASSSLTLRVVMVMDAKTNSTCVRRVPLDRSDAAANDDGDAVRRFRNTMTEDESMSSQVNSRVWWAAVAGVWLLAQATSTSAAVDAEAMLGQPFGVGRITVHIPPDAADGDVPADPILVERNGRALYPAFGGSRLLNLLGQVLGERTDESTVTVWFLFTGAQRLELTLYCPDPIPVALTPRAGRRLPRTRMLTRWWRQYNASVRQDDRDEDSPPFLDTYLTCTLSRRLQLPMPLLNRLKETKEKPERNTWELLVGADSLRSAAMRLAA